MAYPKPYHRSQSLQNANIEPRDLSRARTIVNSAPDLVAVAYPKPTPGKRTDLSENLTGLTRSDRTALSQARTIVNSAPDLVAVAYPEPTRHKRGGQSLETKELNPAVLSQARVIFSAGEDLVDAGQARLTY